MNTDDTTTTQHSGSAARDGRRRTRVSARTLAAASLLLAGVPFAPAAANVQATANAPATANVPATAECTFTMHVSFDPPITPELRESANQTTTPGSIICNGELDGHTLDGAAGKIRLKGVLHGNCAGHDNQGTVRVRLTTARGEHLTFDAAFRNVRTGLRGTLSVDGDGFDGIGSIDATPDAGQDCVRVPLKGVTATGSVRLVS